MNVRRSTKVRCRFRFLLMVNYVSFPIDNANQLCDTQFCVALKRSDQCNQTKVKSIDFTNSNKTAITDTDMNYIHFNEQVSIEVVLNRKRNSTIFMSKQCRIILCQIKS